MCYFLTIGVRDSAADLLAKAIPRELAIFPVSNPSIAHLGATYQTFVLITGMCSCDLYSEGLHAVRKDPQLLRRKYEKKGWSEARIARALESVANAALIGGFVGLRPDVRELIATVAQQTNKLVLVVHWYHGDISTEKLELTDGPQLSPDALRQPDTPVPADQVISIVATTPTRSASEGSS